LTAASILKTVQNDDDLWATFYPKRKLRT